jgi:hypothetical protein
MEKWDIKKHCKSKIYHDFPLNTLMDSAQNHFKGLTHRFFLNIFPIIKKESAGDFIGVICGYDTPFFKVSINCPLLF